MFKSVSISNFLSIKEATFDFQDGTTLITGWNEDDSTSEGSGKSALLNSLTWCLYGKIPKDARIDEVIKTGEKSCTVAVVFDDGFWVERKRNPNQLAMYNTLGEPIMGKDMKATQNIIEDHIGLSFETFCQSVYFPQNYPKKFITATEEEKAKILSQIQDLSDFDKARKVTMSRLRVLDEYELYDSTIVETTSSHLQSLINNYKGLEEIRDNFIENKKRELAELDSRIATKKEEQEKLQREVLAASSVTVDADLKEQMLAIDKQIAELQSKKYQQEADTHLKSQLRNQIEDINKKTEELINKKLTSKNCPTCGQKIQDSAEFSRNIDKELSDLSRQSTELNLQYSNIVVLNDATIEAELETLAVKKATLEDKVDGYQSIVDELKFTERELATVTEEIELLEGQYEKLYESRPNDVLEQIKQADLELKRTTRELQDAERRLKDFKDEKATYNTLKDGFKEVKSYVFQNCLIELNNLANRYASELFEQPIRLHFSNQSDGEGISKIEIRVTLNETTRPLGLLSGGQFRRAQIAVDLALSDIVASRMQNKINLLILDEAFKDLSFESMTKVVELLGKLNKKIILIEHNDMVKSVVDRTVKVELKDGTSQILV